MTIPVGFISRLGIPLVITSLLFTGNLGPNQVKVHDQVNLASDIALSQALGEGETQESFDYIIIGGGSAGAVVANRLSASGQNTVLLIEGGGTPNPISDILFAKRHVTAEGDLMLRYSSIPQENACLEAGSCRLPRAKVLGGCSVINSCVYNRCNSKDYERWAEFTGDSTWGFENVLQAYKNIENYHGAFEDNAGPNHGTSGEVYVSKVDYIPGSDVVLEALAQDGLPTVDLNTGLTPLGFSKIDFNIQSGIRQSSYHAFLEPILDRPNLTIYRYAWATKILFDLTMKAVGVTYERHNRTITVSANKEIILAAGVFDTPKLLMLSGVGPDDHLAELGIPTLLNNSAVGNYLQDHIGMRLVAHPFSVNKTFGLENVMNNASLLQFITNGTGPLNGFEIGNQWATPVAMGYIASSLYNDTTWPDVQIFMHERNIGEEQFYINHVLSRPESYGNVRLRSTNPYDSPIIDPKFLSMPNDLERLAEACERMTTLFLNSPTMQNIGIDWSSTSVKLPACAEYNFPSLDYWKCFAMQKSASDMHPTSTCRMGPNSTVAVVDSKLRVFGTIGLRIIDASVMPWVPSGNTNFPAMMVGEVGAQIILAEQK